MYVMVVQLRVFVGLFTVGAGVSLTLLPVLWIPFLLLGYLVQPYYEGQWPVSLYLLCCVHLIPWEACSFLKGNGGEVDLEERGGRGDW